MTSEVSGFLVAAHELKAPLCLVRQLTLALDLAKTPTERNQLQAELVNVSERALRQVEDLTKISNFDRARFELGPVSVRQVCEDVMHEMSPLFKHERRTLTTHYSNKQRLAVANHDLLRSIIYNFCTNAIHYSNQSTTSHLSVRDYHDKIRVGVRDFGPALPRQIWLDLKSGQFNQPVIANMRPGSSGLGLYIAAQFAKRLHTKLDVTRHQDGTSFFVDLPTSTQLELSL